MNFKYKLSIYTVIGLSIIVSILIYHRDNIDKKATKNQCHERYVRHLIIKHRIKPLLVLPDLLNNARFIKAVFLDTRMIKYINCGDYDECVRWSKKTNFIYMSGDKPGIMKCEYNPNTRSFSKLTLMPDSYKLGSTKWFDISPDESKIITVDDTHGIRILNLDTGKITTIIKKTIFKHGGLQCISYSPNGEFICFTSQSANIYDENEGDHYQDLWVAKSDGSNLKRLGYGLLPEWYLDNNHILTTKGMGIKLIIYNTINDTSKVIWKAKRGSSNINNAVVSPNDMDILINGPLTYGGGEIKNNQFNCGYFLLNPSTKKTIKLPWLNRAIGDYTIDYAFVEIG